MSRLTLYLRREPTTDPVFLRYGKGRKWDVCYYGDAAATKFKARCNWYYRSKPKRNHKTTMLDCYRWDVVWLPDLEPQP